MLFCASREFSASMHVIPTERREWRDLMIYIYIQSDSVQLAFRGNNLE
jgi:hypothetical protein